MAASRPSSAVYLLLVLTDVALASATCPGGWARFDEGGKCYKVTAGRFNALGCAAACGENATLACIRSSSEVDFIASLTRSVGDVWIGLYQSAGAVEPGGGWDTCASGVTTNFTNWLSGYPSNFYRTMIFRDLGELSYANRQCAAKRREYLRNGWFDSPCYLRYRCLCELGAPASAEYLAFMEADIAKGQQLLRTLTGILYGGLIPAAWLVPLAFFCALLACLRLRRKKAPAQEADASFKGGSGSFKGDSGSFKACGEANQRRSSTTRLSSSNFLSSARNVYRSARNVLSSARDVGSPQSPKLGAKRTKSLRENPKLTLKKLTDAVAKADRLRLRVSGTLVLLGWMLLALGAMPPIFANVIDIDLTPIASHIVSYYFALPPGAAVILLALRPTHATPIRIVGVLGVIFSAAALYGALVPLWSVESSASTAGVSVFALNIIRSSGLALIAAVACVLFWHTVSVRFVCRKAAQVKSLAEAIAAGKATAAEKVRVQAAAAAAVPRASYLAEEKAARVPLAETIARQEAAQAKRMRLFKAIQSTSKNTAPVAIQSNAFRLRVLTMPPLNLWFALRLAFIPGDVVYYHNWKTNETTWKEPKELNRREKAQTQIAKIQRGRMARKRMKMKAATADDQKSNMKAPVANDGLTRLMEKVEADPRLVNMTRAIAERVLTNEGGNVGKAFNRLTHSKGTHFNDITFRGSANTSLVKNKWVGGRNAWMEFTLEYTMGPRSQLLGLWDTLRVVCIGVALLYLVMFLSMMLHVPSVDPYGADPVEAGAIENVILSAIALAVALVFTRANRGRFIAWLGTLGKSGMAANARKEAKKLRSRVDVLKLKKGKLSQEEQSELSSSEATKLPRLESEVQKLEAEGKATALAALIGKLSPAEALKLGIDNFRKLDLDKLTEVEIAGRKAGTDAGDWKTSPGWPTRELYNKTSRATFGQVDAFISHSWSDDGVAKFNSLHEWKKDELEKQVTKKAVTIWLDKACLDQRDIQASLAGLPVFIAGCKHLLVLAGDTYASRLWCVIELFVFVQLHEEKDEVKKKLIVKPLASKKTPKDLQEDMEKFKAGEAKTFDPNDRERLLAVIEASFGTLDPFNKIVQDISKFHYERAIEKGIPNLSA